MSKENNMGTYTLTTTGGPTSNGVYVIFVDDGVSAIGLKLSAGGSATLQGAALIKSFGASTIVSLDPSQPTFLSNPTFIDNLTITVISGTVICFTNQ